MTRRRGRGEVVGIGLPGDFEDHHFQGLGHFGAIGEPFSAAQLSNTAWALLDPFCQLNYVMEGVEHEQRLL